MKYDQIYLVDDEELVNLMNTVQFRKLGLEDKLKTFTNPEEALDDLRFRKNMNDRTLILLDINMPEMTGFEFLEFMKLENFPITNDVLIVTSSQTEQDKNQAAVYSEYVEHFITKPLDFNMLKNFIETRDFQASA